MGYTHYWRQSRPFTDAEWTQLLAESRRICAKAMRGDYYTGKEDFASATKVELSDDTIGFRVGFKEEYAWRTFAHPEIPTPMQGRAIKLADSGGNKGTQPAFTDRYIGLNGETPEDYESFILWKHPRWNNYEPIPDQKKAGGAFDCVKTEYRPYDAVVVSILHAARTIAPDAIRVTSDGGDEAIKLMF